MTTDLTVPVVIARFTVPGGTDGAPLLIDGTHRVYRAYAEGVESLPALMLTVDESHRIRSDAFRR